MALTKQTLPINFAGGLDLRTDPWQIRPGRFLSLQNSIFNKDGQLLKRNGYLQLPSISNAPSFLSTFAGNLTAIGSSFQVYSQETGSWTNRGNIQPVDLDVVSAVRSSIDINTNDAAVAPNGLACVVWSDPTSGDCLYQVVDSSTGQIIVSQTTAVGGGVLGFTFPKVFVLGSYFIITFISSTSGTRLQYRAIPIANPSNPGAITEISSSFSSAHLGYDGYSSGGKLYLSWSGGDAGGSIRSTYIDSQLNQYNTFVVTGYNGPDYVSVTVDTSDVSGRPVMWVSWFNIGDTFLYSMALQADAVTNQLASLVAPTFLIAGAGGNVQITSTAAAGVVSVFYSAIYAYAFSSTNTSATGSVIGHRSGGTLVLDSNATILRGVAITGKAFYLSSTGKSYMLVAYGQAFQPTFFLIDGSGNVVSKLSYETGGGWITGPSIPQANVTGNSVTYSYLHKFLAVPVNDAQGVANPGGIYGQKGINLATFTINPGNTQSGEIAGAVHLTGGFVWEYDGNKPVEHGFHVWPEDITTSTATGSGGLIAQTYYYYFCYAWTDAAGNVHRSAPSIPYKQVTTTASSTNTINVPTYRQTYKVSPNSVRIEGYRYSAAQQVPYMFTSQTDPVLNDPTVDYIVITDDNADADILGNEILYTFGGTVEDIAAPPASAATLFKSRLFVVDAEDRNLLWFSKVVIESTPVEFSDILTLYVAPTIGSQGSTGPITALSVMDDKLIIFKENAIYYITGDGPDNTGANSDYGDAVFITSNVGCDNPNSIVFMPQGLMFQSDKGIWLLGRDLSTKYIGAPIQDFNDETVLSAVAVPGSNMVLFTMSGGLTLMYDYFTAQWGSFSGIPAVSSTIYGGVHTFLNSSNQVFQENPGSYLDGSNPVLMSFTTGWLNLTGLQGYQRAYEFYLLGQYLSPHKLSVGVAYDYNPSVQHSVVIQPDNFSGTYGDDPTYGTSDYYGGYSQVEQWRVFLTQQKCQAFQIVLNEVFDPTKGVVAGAGFTLSGINLVYGMVKGYPRLPTSRQIG